MNDRIGLGVLRILGLVVALAAVALVWRMGPPSNGNDAASPQAQVEAGAGVAEANLRASLPAVQAYFAGNGSYDGLADGLASVDPASAGTVVVVSASGAWYCIQSTAGTETASMRAPGGDVVPGPC